MKILLLTTHLDIGGIAVYVASLAKSLVKRAHKVIVISASGDMVGELTGQGVSHIKLDIKTKSELSPKLWFNLKPLGSIIRQEKPDIIHAQTRITGVLASILARNFNIPYISTCHGFFRNRLSRRLFGCWGDRVIAISEAVKEHLINDFGIEENRIELIPNGVDIDRFKHQFSKDQIHKTKLTLGLGEESVIGTIGRLSSVKGLDSLIYAFGNSPFLNKTSTLLIVGNGPEKEKFIKIIRSLNIENRVRILESSLDTPTLLSIMDVFAFPSLQEGLGLALIEAMASGRAVVATDVGGIRSLVKDNETGLLTKKGDRKTLAEAINRLLGDEKLRNRLGSNGREFVQREYTLDKMVDRTEQLYKRLIRR